MADRTAGVGGPPHGKLGISRTPVLAGNHAMVEIILPRVFRGFRDYLLQFRLMPSAIPTGYEKSLLTSVKVD
jgi:hypothetical protein